MSTRPSYWIFGDGSATRNEDIGAWAAIAIAGDNVTRKFLWGIGQPLTISRCEMLPVLEGLRFIKYHWHPARGQIIRVTSDSEWAIRTLSGDFPVNKHEDIIEGIHKLAHGLTVEYRWRERNSTPYGTLMDNICGPLRRHMLDTMGKITKDPRQPELEMPMLALPEEMT